MSQMEEESKSPIRRKSSLPEKVILIKREGKKILTDNPQDDESIQKCLNDCQQEQSTKKPLRADLNIDNVEQRQKMWGVSQLGQLGCVQESKSRGLKSVKRLGRLAKELKKGQSLQDVLAKAHKSSTGYKSQKVADMKLTPGLSNRIEISEHNSEHISKSSAKKPGSNESNNQVEQSLKDSFEDSFEIEKSICHSNRSKFEENQGKLCLSVQHTKKVFRQNSFQHKVQHKVQHQNLQDQILYASDCEQSSLENISNQSSNEEPDGVENQQPPQIDTQDARDQDANLLIEEIQDINYLQNEAIDPKDISGLQIMSMPKLQEVTEENQEELDSSLQSNSQENPDSLLPQLLKSLDSEGYEEIDAGLNFPDLDETDENSFVCLQMIHRQSKIHEKSFNASRQMTLRPPKQ